MAINGTQGSIIEVIESTTTVELVALAMQCEPQQRAKTLSFHVGDQVIFAVTVGDAKIDNRKYRECVGEKQKCSIQRTHTL